MHCTLLVADLLLPSSSDAGLYRELPLPNLARLLARGAKNHHTALSMESWLCTAFGIERQRDWPIAALTLTGDGADPGAGYWLRCDPAHLRPQRGQLLLAGGDQIAPTLDEAHALIATLNAHFIRDGITFITPHPERWYLNVPIPPALSTHEFSEVAGRDIHPFLPAGDDRLRWHQRLNEVQMLLHEHPVNEARAALNKPAINSVWLWGGGVLPEVSGRPYTRVWSDDLLPRALATRSQIPAHALPRTATTVVDSAAGDTGNQLVVVSQLRAAARNGDIERWRTALMTLEHNWVAPLHEALRRRRISGLTLIGVNLQHCMQCEITARDLWKFWRRTRSPACHA